MAAPLSRALPVALGRARVPVTLAARTRFYRAPPLRRGAAPVHGDPEDLRAAARRFGRLGEASGVPAGRLWPDAERLRQLEAEEREWDPPLRDVLAELDRREREEARRKEERAQLVAQSLATMAARVSAWRQERAAALERTRRDAQRRQRLLLQAGFKGGVVTTKGGTDARAQALLQDLERQQRREEKRRRRQERQEAAREAMAAAEAAAAAQPPPRGEGVSS